MQLLIEPVKPTAAFGNPAEDHNDMFVSLKVKTIEWYKRKLNENDEELAILQILPNYNYDSDEDQIVR